MTITKVSLQVALELASGECWSVEEFFVKAKPGEVFHFCHYNFYYSYPEFGKKWNNGLLTQFHQIHTCCSKCQEQSGRNFAGIGSLYLCMNEDRKASFLCDDCAKGLKFFGSLITFEQATLF